MLRLYVVLLVILSLTLRASAAAPARYVVEDLGSDPWQISVSTSPRINDRGQVIMQHGDGVIRVDPDGTTTLVSPYGQLAYAFDIGAGGDVLGLANGSYRFTDAGGFEKLASGAWTRTNTAGVLCGSTSVPSHYGAALYDSANGIRFLLPPGGAGSQATDINEAGQVVGYQYGENSNFLPWTWTASNGLRYLSELTGIYSTPSAVNNRGHIIGELWSGFEPRSSRAYYLTPEGLRFLDTGGFSIWAADLNDADQALLNDGATSQDPVNAAARGHAFLYTPEGGLEDLNGLIDPTSGWDIYMASGINNAGQIAGRGWFRGSQHVFRLTPAAASVPEPGSLALLAFGLVPFAGHWNVVRRPRRSRHH